MDIPRPDEARKRCLRRIIYSVLGRHAHAQEPEKSTGLRSPSHFALVIVSDCPVPWWGVSRVFPYGYPWGRSVCQKGSGGAGWGGKRPPALFRLRYPLYIQLVRGRLGTGRGKFERLLAVELHISFRGEMFFRVPQEAFHTATQTSGFPTLRNKE